MAHFPISLIAGPPGCLSLTPDCAEVPQGTVGLVVKVASEKVSATMYFVPILFVVECVWG